MNRHSLLYVLGSSVFLFGFRTDYPTATMRWSYEGQLSADAPVGQDEDICGEPEFYTAGSTKGLIEQFSDGSFHLLGFGCITPAVRLGDPVVSDCYNEQRLEGLPRFAIKHFELVDDKLTIEGDEFLGEKKFCFHLTATATAYSE